MTEADGRLVDRGAPRANVDAALVTDVDTALDGDIPTGQVDAAEAVFADYGSVAGNGEVARTVFLSESGGGSQRTAGH